MIPVAIPAAAATAATPLPPPYVAVDMPLPVKDPLQSQSRHPPAAGTVILSPSLAVASAGGHTAVRPAAAPDLEAGEVPFRLWYVLFVVSPRIWLRQSSV